MIDLQQFCSVYEHRVDLKTPISRGDYTYASNGQIAIRVPRVDGIPEAPFDISVVFADYGALAHEPMPLVHIPEVASETCKRCSGVGRTIMCPTCDGYGGPAGSCKTCNGDEEIGSLLPEAEPCFRCGGTGITLDDRPIDFGDQIYLAARYVQMMQRALAGTPSTIARNPRQPSDTWKNVRAQFFAGGVAVIAIAPLRCDGDSAITVSRVREAV